MRTDIVHHIIDQCGREFLKGHCCIHLLGVDVDVPGELDDARPV